MKNFKLSLFFVLISFLSFISSASAVEIVQKNISTPLSKGADGTISANVDLDKIFDPEGRRYAMSFGFDKNKLIKTKLLDCNNLGKTMLTCYYNNGGKRDSTYLLVELYDNKGLCPQKQTPDDTISVFGNIKTQSGKSVEAEVIFVKYDISQKVEKTMSIDGGFVFDNLEQEFYGLEIKNIDLDCINGLSTADIVKIQRHILDKERLVSPYQLIAADVNNDKKITSADIKILRDMILGRISRWPSFRPAWMFFPKDYKFVNNTVPWNSMPSAREWIPLQGPMEKNYIAVKLGDVNDSNIGNLEGSELQTRLNFEDPALEEEARRNDVLIEELEGTKEVLLYQINVFNGSSIKAYKKTKI